MIRKINYNIIIEHKNVSINDDLILKLNNLLESQSMQLAIVKINNKKLLMCLPVYFPPKI